MGEAYVSVDANTSHDIFGAHKRRSLNPNLHLHGSDKTTQVRTHAVDKVQSTASPFSLKAYIGLYGLSPKMVEFQNHSEEALTP